MGFLLPDVGLHASRMAAELAVSQLWQGMAVAAGLALSLRLAPRTRASHRFALWMAAFVLVAALPLVPWFMAALRPNLSAGAAAQAVAPAATTAWFRLDERWGVAVLAVWALLAALRLAMLAAGAVRARRVWKRALPLEGAENLLAERLVARARVELCQSNDLDRPSVIGFFRPRILVPEWLVSKLSEGELRQIVLHELEHLHRMDDWSNLALKFVAALLPLNPALWWMERELEREREMATDEAVVRRTRAPRAYAACLATVAERRLQMRLSQRALLELGIWRRRPELAERILSLLRTKETIGPAGRTALAGSLAIGLMAAATMLAHAPQLVSFAPLVPTALPMVAEAHAAPVVLPAVAVSAKPKNPVMHHAALAKAAPPREVATETVPGFVPVVAALEPQAAEAAHAANGWVVLAVFEQRVATSRQGTIEADYIIQGAEATGGSKAPAAAKSAAPPRLIWKLLPVAPLPSGVVVLEL